MNKSKNELQGYLDELNLKLQLFDAFNEFCQSKNLDSFQNFLKENAIDISELTQQDKYTAFDGTEY